MGVLDGLSDRGQKFRRGRRAIWSVVAISGSLVAALSIYGGETDGSGAASHSDSFDLAAATLAAPASSSPAFSIRPGTARDIAVGANGAVWAVGTNPVAGGFGIYEWTGDGWLGVPGGAVTIAVAQNGSPWVINSAQHIYFG